MNDLTTRVDQVEQDISTIKVDLAALRSRVEAELPHLATRAQIERIEAILPHLATHADVERMGRLVIMWNVGTLIAVAGIVFAILKLL